MTEQMDGQVSLFDPGSWSGRMSPEHSAPTTEKTSPQSSKKRSKSQSRKPPLFLCLKRDGQPADVSWVTDGALLGVYSIHSFGESPRDGAESRLSQILEATPHPKYYLSAKACRGILNRAARRGKDLPEALRKALEAQSIACKETESTEQTPQDATEKDGKLVAYGIGNGQVNEAATMAFEKAQTLNTMHDAQAVFCQDVAHTLKAKANLDFREDSETYPVQSGKVRRITPLECERLQGFPDGWTDIGEWVDSKGKKRKTADSSRYKALGNSIALPPWKWVLKRLCAQYERDATMASLFDGIGGFPFLWEQLNGKGSCLWASEIEEFPMAVTSRHFG